MTTYFPLTFSEFSNTQGAGRETLGAGCRLTFSTFHCHPTGFLRNTAYSHFNIVLEQAAKSSSRLIVHITPYQGLALMLKFFKVE